MVLWAAVAGALIGMLLADNGAAGLILGGFAGTLMGKWLRHEIQLELYSALAAADAKRPDAAPLPPAPVEDDQPGETWTPEPEAEPEPLPAEPEPVADLPPEVLEEPEPEPVRAAAMDIPASRITAPVEPEPEPDVEPEYEPEADWQEEPARSEEPAPAMQRAAINFEELFGRRLPIWAGGITLAIAGILIVKYAIDQGIFGRIFTPGVQAVCGLLFGLGLIGGAEWAWRQREKVADPRISQALSGAGISTLYAATLVAANLYGLISPLTAFFGLALVTGGALWLSLRHGMPTALLGLAGGLAAPALTLGYEANVPLLAVYLGFTIAGLVGVARVQRWPWLALIALLGGAGWSLWLIIMGKALETVGALSVGGFVALLALALPLFVMTDKGRQLLRAVAAVVGAAQLGLLVALGGFQPLHWGLFALLAAAAQFIAWRERDFAIVPTIGAALAFILLMLWPQPDHGWLLTFGLVLAAIHAAPLFVRLWEAPPRLQRTIELAAIALAAPIVALRQVYHPGDANDLTVALSALGGAIVLLAAAARGWKVSERQTDSRLAILFAGAAALLVTAAWFAFAHWQAPVWTMAIAVALLLLAPPSGDKRIEPLGFVVSLVALVQLGFTALTGRMGEFGLPLGVALDPLRLDSLLRWGALATGFALFAWRAGSKQIAITGYALTTALSYGALAQLVPEWTLPIVMAALNGALLLILTRREGRESDLLVALFGFAGIALLAITGDNPVDAWARLSDSGPAGPDPLALLRWAAVAALALLCAARARTAPLRTLGQFGAMTFAYGALAQVVPGWTLPIVMAAVAALGLYGLTRRAEPRSEWQALVFAAAAIGLLMCSGSDPAGEWQRLFGAGDGTLSGVAAARWGVVALLGAFFAWRSRLTPLRQLGEVGAALLGYGALAQIVPLQLLPLVAPAALLAVSGWSRTRPWPLLALGSAALLALIIGWAALPIAQWLDQALRSLAGIPFLLDRPDLAALEVGRRLAGPALLLGGSIWLQRQRVPQRVLPWLVLVAGTLGLLSVHLLYRHLFAALLGTDFVATGPAQRLLWAGLLLGASWLLLRRKAGSTVAQGGAAVLAATAAFHVTWYSLLLHNPLWSAQQVGAWPVLNLIAPLFALLPLGLHVLGQAQPRLAGPIGRIMQPVLMLSVVAFAWASLRQAFHGTLLVDPGVSEVEDILRSILGIGLAIGFLLWGIRRKRHDWRIASLVLMLVAVAKVFLLDASGLEGLLRIASFVALGFSLIGIGWLYSRQLRRDEQTVE